MNVSVRKFPLVLLLALLAVLTVAVVACGGDDDEGDDGGPTAGDSTPDGDDDDDGDDGEVTLDISMGDNFFEYEGEQNPTIKIPANAEVTINLTNDGAAIHNMRFAGEDNAYNSDDDAVSDPDIVTAGQEATLTFTAPGEPGVYDYQCDFHPTDMLGEFEVE